MSAWARRGVAAAVAVAVLAVACGDDGSGSPRAKEDGDVRVAVLSSAARAKADPSDAEVAGRSITAFGSDLYRAVADGAGANGNVIVSPASVAIALAMLEPGATGEAQQQLRAALRIEDPERFHTSMNALEQDLEARVAEAHNPGEKPGEVTVGIANAAYLQRGYPFIQGYLDTVGRHYGPVVQAVDFAADPDAVAHEINRFVEEATADRIKDLVADGVLRPDHVLALVNALSLKASWLQVFDKATTKDGPFHRRSGPPVTVPMMHGSSGASARGDGWVAATKHYVGGLAAQFVLPDEGRFDEVAADVDRVISEFDRRATKGAALVVPRFTTRFHVSLEGPFEAVGLDALFQENNLLGVADDPTLRLDVALHEAYVAMDEEGTEAAAATVLVAAAVSAPVQPPVPVVLDRPFLFRIFDPRSGATLFLGRILDPTA